MVAATQSTLARMAALCTCMALAGCSMMETRSRDDALRDLAWNYEQQGILLNVQADPMLNETNGQPHNLLLLVAQMEDPNAFAAHVREQERLAELLLADRAPDGILDVQRFHVEPGTQRAMHIARVQSARYVGVATGYAQLDPARSARLYQVGVTLDRAGWVFREYTASPEPLAIQLRLGPAGIQDSLSGRAEPSKPVQPAGGLVEIGSNYPATVITPSSP